MYKLSHRARGGDRARAPKLYATHALRARRALLSGTALVGAAVCVSLAIAPTPALAVDISTQAQLDAAIAGGVTTINIVAGNLALSNAQMFASGTDLTVAAGASLSIASNQVVGSLTGAGTLNLGTNGLAVGTNNSNTAFSGTINLTNQGYNPTYGTFAKTGTGTLTINNATITQGESYIVQGAMAQTSGNTTFTYLAVGTGTTGGNPNVGALNVSGGTISFGTGLQVGDFGGQGTLNQTGGTVTVAATCGDFSHCAALHIGNQGGTGTYNISGGELDLVGGNNELGRSTGNKPASAGTLNISGTGVIDLSGNGAGGGAIIIGYGNENVAPNTSQGLINQTGGTLRIHNGSTLYLTGANSSSSVYNLNGGTLEIGGAGLKAGYGGTSNPYQFNLGGGTIKVIEAALVTSVNATLTGGVSTIDTNGLGATWSGVLSGAGGLAKVGAGTLKLSGLNTYSGVTNVNAGTLQAGAANTFSSASAVTVGTGATLDLNGFNQSIGSIAGAGTVTNNGAGAATLTAGADNTSTTFSGTLKDGPSAKLALTKTGSGFLTLTGTNTYTGGTTISGGFLLLGDGNTTAKIVGTVTNNAFFEIVSADTSGITAITNNGSTTFDAGTSASSAAITTNGVGRLLSFTGNSTAANATITTNAGAKTQFLDTSTGGNAQFITNAGGIVDFSGTTGPASNRQISAGSIAGAGSYFLGANQLTVGSNGLNSTVSGVISDCGIAGTQCNAIGATGGSLVKAGAGTLTLSGTNTYTGGTVLNAGTLAVGSNAALGTGTLTIANGATLQAAVAGLSLANAITLSGAATIDTQANGIALTGPIGGGGGFTKTGTGVLVLSGNDTYSGATNVNAGTLGAGAATALSSASAFTIAAGATLDISGFNQSIGSLAGPAGTVTNSGATPATLTTGSDNTSTTFSGTIQDGAGTTSLTKVGTGTFTLSAASTYTGATTVNNGTLAVTGDISSSSGVTANAGGTLSGTGFVKNITINNGATLAPGLRSTPGTLTARGSLVMQGAATYLVQVSPAAQSLTTVSGTASLNGMLAINATPGSGYAFGTKYTVLSAAGGINGTFVNTTATSGPVTATVSYDAHDVFLTFSQAFLTMPVSASGNAKGVANALNAYIADPPLPPAFQSLFNLTPAQLAEALAQLSGENNAGGGQQASFQLMNEFLLLMLNPFDADRGGGFGGAGFGAGDGIARFAPDQQRALPPEVAQAYAAVTPASKRAVPFSARWNVWASAFGGTNNTNGDPNGTGSHGFNARTGGIAAGVDYKLTPNTLVGFALAGGGTSWGLSQGLGGGSTDAFQAGLYGSQKFGPWYVSGAVAFANYWASTTRTITLPAIDTLNAGFNAQSWGGRAEAGYRIAWAPVNLAPYVAVQAQSFSTPNYTETATSGSNLFALSYASHTASVVRSELGSWLSNTYRVADNALVTAFGRAAWAHDWEDTPQATATFVGLAPIASFIVNGGKPAADLALVTAGAEIRMASGWALMGKFDGEFGDGTQTYVGTARARYAW